MARAIHPIKPVSNANSTHAGTINVSIEIFSATSGPNAGNGVAEKRQGKFKGICYRCKAKGHSFRFCPLNEGADVERRVVRPISGYQNNTGVTCKSS